MGVEGEAKDPIDGELARRVLRIRKAFIERRMAAGIAPIDMVLIDMVYLGELEERPYDASSISEATGLSRSTASRHLRNLEKRGLIEQRPAGRNRYYYCTEVSRERFLPLLLQIARLCGFVEE